MPALLGGIATNLKIVYHQLNNQDSFSLEMPALLGGIATV